MAIFGVASPYLTSGTDRTSGMEHRKPGRPSKGDRERFTVRLPEQLAEAARKHAALHGLTFNDLVGHLLAADLQVPYDQQEGLPLTAA